jgi:hypothetical protein
MKRRRNTRGQGMTEFALVMPVLLLLVMGIIDFGRVLTSFAMTSNALRSALRTAQVIGYADDKTVFGNCAALRSILRQTFFTGALDVTIEYWHANAVARFDYCNANEEKSLSLFTNGDILKINVRTSIGLITPLVSRLFPRLTIDFSGQRTIVTGLNLSNDPDDDDYDGLDDGWELGYFGNIDTWNGTDDPDFDGCPNGCEETRSLNPLNSDTDGDSLKDGDEIYTYETLPGNRFTDEDSLTDGQEVITYRTNPKNKDTDGDEEWDGVDPHPLNVPTLSISDGLGIATEPGFCLLNVTLTYPLALNTVKVWLTTENRTAISGAGGDYAHKNEQLTFTGSGSSVAGSSPPVTQTVAITVLSDFVIEVSETFAVKLSSPTPSVSAISDGAGICTIAAT